MLKAFSILFSGNLIGKILGAIREVIIAAFYGTSAPAAALRISQSATLIPVNFFTAESLNAVFVPLFTKYKLEDEKRANNFAWCMFILIGSISIVLSVILFLGARVWVSLLAPGFTEDVVTLTVKFVEIMSIGIPFYLMTSVISYYEISNKIYIMSSIRASVQSVGLIVGAVASFYFDSLSYLAWGFSGAYIYLLLHGLFNLYRKDLIILPSFNLPEIKIITRDFWKLLKPLLLIPFILQGNIFTEKVVASLLGVGVVASLDYARFISETGLLLIAVPIGTIFLSELSNATQEHVENLLHKIIPVLMMITIPLSLFFICNSEGIISLFYARGAFDSESVQLTQNIFIGISIGLWATITAYILQKVLNAQMKNKVVVKIMAVSVVANIATNIFLYKILGPLTLGVGASLYGIIYLILASYKLGILKFVVKNILLVGAGSIVYIPIATIITGNSIFNLIISALVFFIFWLLYLLSIKSLRNAVMPVLMNRLKKQKKVTSIGE
ncbi:putative lipid II flippase MurJ [Paenibacillus sp. J45TS6]|uniref:murein biosynthesis integral membrane protein MurJ n=1 Tax=Paenibacillus sp. J45TS6 TaxID=2807196 RepID=UPI001B0906AA|nr:lipid II flippase MurJ [Paenibacillus sp. J45TS6]GIP44131.1 putative lipid II flippase MurJ [Paenibacillus sp. J45TS6]